MDKKALFLDLDGTLLDDEKNISDANLRAVHKALSKGHYVIVATGRPLMSGIALSKKLGLTHEGCCVIAFNGCNLYDIAHEKVLFRSTLPLEVVQTVFAEAAKRNIYIHTYGEDSVIVEKRCDGETVRRYCGYIGLPYEVVPDIRTLKRAPEKMLVIDYENPEPLKIFREWLLSSMGDRLDSFFSSNEYLEVVNKGMNKGTALIQMAEILGVSPENTYAAGDSANDVDMLRAAHLGIAMKNASEDAKAAADAITEQDNNHDGVAEIIEKYIL